MNGNRCALLALSAALSWLAACSGVPVTRRPAADPAPADGRPSDAAAAPSERVARLQDGLRRHSFERVLCPEDLEDATVRFTHFADELDALENDYYQVTGKGVVLGIQDSQYVIFTTRCALDFTWPNHDIRWRNTFGFEDGPPDFRNEGIILHGTSAPGGEDEYFTYGSTNLQQIPGVASNHPVLQAREQRRATLALARDAGDVVTVDRFEGDKGELSDVVLLYVPIHRKSTIRMRHLGLAKPKDSVRGLLAKQGILFGMEFEFSCPECQRVVAGYRSREREAFALGFALGRVTGVFLEGFIERLADVDDVLASGKPLPTSRIDPRRRIASAGLRRQILKRDGVQCAYAKFGMCDPSTCWACIAKNLHIDHVVAYIRGGKTVPSNLVAACAACNASKGYELLSSWLRSSQ